LLKAILTNIVFLDVKEMATVSITMGKLVAGIVIAILASSAISVGASMMLATGPERPQGPNGSKVASPYV
jgi:hypothetical protein